MSFVFDAFDRMAEQVGLPAMQFRFGVCLLSVIPLGLLHRCLPTYPGRNLHKHAYSALAGLFQSILVYEWTSLHMILGTLVTYLLMILFRKNCGWIVTVAAIIHVTIGNYDRMMNDYLGYTLNWTLSYMLLIVRLSSMAWAYQDGLTDTEGWKGKDRDGYIESHKIVELPHILEVFSYSFFFVGFLTGPWTDYKEWSTYNDRTMFKEGGGRIPWAWKFLLQRTALLAVAFYFFIQIDNNPLTYLISDEYMALPLWHRLWYYLYMPEMQYCKYYTVWFLGEIGCAVSGVSFSGYVDGVPQWEGGIMINMMGWRFPTSIKGTVANWNLPTANWLKHYVHVRYLQAGLSRSSSQMATYVLSAVWHGLYPGYYIFFIHCAVLTQVGEMMSRTFLPFALNEDGSNKYPQKYIFNGIAWTLIILCLNYLTPAFQLFSLERGWVLFKGIYFIGHMVPVFFLILCFIIKFTCPKRMPVKPKSH